MVTPIFMINLGFLGAMGEGRPYSSDVGRGYPPRTAKPGGLEAGQGVALGSRPDPLSDSGGESPPVEGAH